MKNNCGTCEYKRLNANRDKGHCYMFETEPEQCGVYKCVNVGTIGHVDHGNVGLAAAILQLLNRSA